MVLGGGTAVIVDDTKRAEEVYRRWRRTSFDVMGRSTWAGWTLEDAAFFLSLASAMMLLLLEPALWFRGWPPFAFDDLVLSWLAPSFLAVPIHGWLLDRYLSAKTPAERAMPRWLLAARFVAASVPLFAFALLPAWRRLLERRPNWAFRGHRPHPSLCFTRSPSRTRVPGRLLRLYTSGVFAGWMALGFALPLLWAAWLARTHQPSWIVAACVPLHLVVFVGARFQAARLPGRGSLAAVLPWLALLPLPGPFVGAFSLVISQTGGNTETLAWSAWARRTIVDRLPLWRQLRDTLRSRWSSASWFERWWRPRLTDRPIRAGALDRDLLSYYRRRTALLLLEGGALVTGLALLAEGFPRLGSAVNTVLSFATWFEVSLAGIGLTIWLGAAIVRFLRLPNLAESEIRIFGRYLLLTSSAFLAGSQAGFVWVSGQRVELGLIVAYGGALLAILTWLIFIPNAAKAHGLGTSTLWSLAFLALALAGLPIALNERLGGWPGRMLGISALLTPVWSLLLFRRFGHWLPRPFLWRDLSDPRLPRRVRAALTFLRWTALLPGGGLAIPTWIALRSFLDQEVLIERQGRTPRNPPCWPASCKGG